MRFHVRDSSHRALAVLNPVFALTGVLHVSGGALLPSLAGRFHLSDSDAGFLFLLYFAGTSLGALLCRGNYARIMTLGFLGTTACCIGIATSDRAVLSPLFLLLGIGVGVPMSSVSLYVGRAFPERCAPTLALLNFSWSIGALAAPLLAAQVLRHHTYRMAYLLFAASSMIAAIACVLLPEASETPRADAEPESFFMLRFIIVFACAAFLDVGIENTITAWLPSYALRMAQSGIVIAAVSSSFYWVGYLSSRGASSLLLLRVEPARVLRFAVVVGLVAALALALIPSVSGRNAAMFLLGVALAPIFPLVIAGSLSRVRRTSDSRWVLATAGFGGSVLPWLAGWISARTSSLRMGMLTIPSALMLMLLMLSAFRETRLATAEPQETSVK